MSLSKTEAKRAGTLLLDRMVGEGWELRVWENSGWHYSVYNGCLNVHPAEPNGFSCLLSSDVNVNGGLAMWTTDFTHEDPNEVALHEIKNARSVIKRLDRAVSASERVFCGWGLTL